MPIDRRLDGLQALRFFAAAMVVITHSTFYTSERLSAMPVWPNGTRGVDIFFVISGFVMIWSSQKLMHQADGWKVFIIKRINRVTPLYWFATSLKILIMIFAGSQVLHSSLNFESVIKSYFFIPSLNKDGKMEPILGVGWTLNFEMFFYIVFAISLLISSRIYVICGVILAFLAAISFYRGIHYPSWQYYANDIVLEFFLGMLIARYFIIGKKVPRALSCVMLAAGLGWTIFSRNQFHLIRIVDCGIPAALIVAGVVALEQDIRRGLPSYFLFLGNASYAIYLFHPIFAPFGAVLMAKLHLKDIWLSVALCWTIGIAAGCLAYLFVEPRLAGYWSQVFRRRSAEVSVGLG